MEIQADFSDPSLGDVALVVGTKYGDTPSRDTFGEVGHSEQKVFFVSRGILAMWSPVLKSMLFNGWCRESLDGATSSSQTLSTVVLPASPVGPGRRISGHAPSDGEHESAQEEGERTPQADNQRKRARDDVLDGAASSQPHESEHKRQRKEEETTSVGKLATARNNTTADESSWSENATLASEGVPIDSTNVNISATPAQDQRSTEKKDDEVAFSGSDPNTHGLPVLLLPEENPKEFEFFLRKLYPPCDLAVTRENVVALMTLADRYGVDRLLDECEKVVAGWEPSFETLEFASRFSMRDVADRCLNSIMAGPLLTLGANEDTEAMLRTLSKATLAQAAVTGMRAIRQLATAAGPSHLSDRARLYDRITICNGMNFQEVGDFLAHGSANLVDVAPAIFSEYSAVMNRREYEEDGIVTGQSHCANCAELRRLALRKNGTARPAEVAEYLEPNRGKPTYDGEPLTTIFDARNRLGPKKWSFIMVTKIEQLVFCPRLADESRLQMPCVCASQRYDPDDFAQEWWAEANKDHKDAISIWVYDTQTERPTPLCSVRCDVSNLQLGQLKQAVISHVLGGQEQRPHENVASFSSRLNDLIKDDAAGAVSIARRNPLNLDDWYVFEEETPDNWNFCNDENRHLQDFGLRNGDLLHFEYRSPEHHPVGSTGDPSSLGQKYYEEKHRRPPPPPHRRDIRDIDQGPLIPILLKENNPSQHHH